MFSVCQEYLLKDSERNSLGIIFGDHASDWFFVKKCILHLDQTRTYV